MSGSDQQTAPEIDLAGHPNAVTDLTNTPLGRAARFTAESPEDPKDQQHRHHLEQADATLRRWKDGFRFGLCATTTTVVMGLCVYIVMDKTAATEQQQWARTIVAGIFSAMAGYFIGKKGSE